jgi:hypothetical protein
LYLGALAVDDYDVHAGAGGLVLGEFGGCVVGFEGLDGLEMRRFGRVGHDGVGEPTMEVERLLWPIFY